MKELKLEDGSALALVAHPDDETIWMGGTILLNPQIKWTIFSLCRRDDTDRAPKFRRVCKIYGAKAIISDLEDDEKLNMRESLPEIRERILRELPQKRFAPLHLQTARKVQYRKINGLNCHLEREENSVVSVSGFDYIFTHAYNGEYGHPRHKGVHRVLKDLIKNKKLSASRVFCFNYELDEKNGCAKPKTKSDIVIDLDKNVFERKQKIINGIYGFSKSSFEYKSCARRESFNRLIV